MRFVMERRNASFCGLYFIDGNVSYYVNNEDSDHSYKLLFQRRCVLIISIYRTNIFTTSVPDFTKYTPAGSETLTTPDPECTKVPDIE